MKGIFCSAICRQQLFSNNDTKATLCRGYKREHGKEAASGLEGKSERKKLRIDERVDELVNQQEGKFIQFASCS